MTGLTFENENVLLGYLLKIETMATVFLSGTYMIVWYSTVYIFPEKQEIKSATFKLTGYD